MRRDALGAGVRDACATPAGRVPVNGSDMTHTDKVPALVGLFGTDGR